MRRAAGTALLLLVLLAAGALAEAVRRGYRLSLWLAPPGERSRIEASDGAPLWISAWRPAQGAGQRRPAILFLHGYAREGLRAAHYPLLCESLARQGFVVMAPWLRGYPGAHRPGPPFAAERWDPRPDIEATLARLAADPEVDPTAIFVVGHSSAGANALLLGLGAPGLAGAVSLSRLDLESRFERPEYRESSRARHAETFGVELPPEAFPTLAQLKSGPFLSAQVLLQRPDHPPALLAVGGAENPKDRRWLRSVADAASGPVEYREFAGLDHQLRVRDLHLGPVTLGLYPLQGPPHVAAELAGWAHWARSRDGV